MESWWKVDKNPSSTRLCVLRVTLTPCRVLWLVLSPVLAWAVRQVSFLGGGGSQRKSVTCPPLLLHLRTPWLAHQVLQTHVGLRRIGRQRGG